MWSEPGWRFALDAVAWESPETLLKNSGWPEPAPGASASGGWGEGQELDVFRKAPQPPLGSTALWYIHGGGVLALFCGSGGFGGQGIFFGPWRQGLDPEGACVPAKDLCLCLLGPYFSQGSL